MKMVVMSRILEAAKMSQTVTEGVGHERVMARHIYSELCAANEPNLLDEADMEIFGLRPMTDPLHLVCCQACKKPVKASQYSAHAELCRSVSSSPELFSELDGLTRPKKPPKKERKRLISTGKASMTLSEKVKSDLCDTHLSNLHFDGGVVASSSLLVIPSDGPSHNNMVNLVRHSGPSLAKADNFGAGVVPREKRPKIRISAGSMRLSDGAVTPREGCSDVFQKPSSYVPVPLACKTYYSQRGNRFRATLSHMYHSTAPQKQQHGLESPKMLELDQITHTGHSSVAISHHPDDQFDKEMQLSNFVLTPNEACAPQMMVNVDETTGNQQLYSFSNHLSVNDAQSSQTASVGLMRNIYRPQPYSFVRKSGVPLETLQQQTDGSVPVV